VDVHALDVVGLLDALGLDRVVLVGMSLGGIVSLAVALDHPERVTALALVDVGPAPDPVGVSRVNTFMRETDSFTSLDDAVDHALAFSQKRDRRLLEWTLRWNLMPMADGTLTWKYDRRHRTTDDHVDGIVARNRELAERIEELECPLLLVYGERSDVISASEAEAFARRARNGRSAAAEGAGHSVQGDNPSALLAQLNRFLDEIAQRTDEVGRTKEHQ
jgi:pimeloyl-ACP methyl ester carboxylesterase